MVRSSSVVSGLGRRGSAVVLEAVKEGEELAVSSGATAAPLSVEVVLVDVATSAATTSVWKVPIRTRLAKITLIAENAIV